VSRLQGSVSRAPADISCEWPERRDEDDGCASRGATGVRAGDDGGLPCRQLREGADAVARLYRRRTSLFPAALLDAGNLPLARLVFHAAVLGSSVGFRDSHSR